MSEEAESWVFDDPPDLGVFVTRDVLSGNPPTIVEHDLDGDWAFSAGMPFEVDDTVLVHLGWVVERHPRVRSIANMPRGKGARLREEEWAEYEVAETD